MASPAPDAPRQVSGIMTRLVVGYVRSQAGEEGVRRLLELAGDERSPAVLEDETTWSTFVQSDALIEAACILLDDPEAGIRIGASALQQKVGTSLVLLLRALGSPAALMRNLPRIAHRFTAGGPIEVRELGATSAVIALEPPPEAPRNEIACQTTTGLLTQIPVLFGLPPAVVTHLECAARGGTKDVYSVTWSPKHRRRWGAKRWRVVEAERVAEGVTEQLEALQSTVADLVSSGDVDTVLERIATRAAAAVRAQRYLLAVRPRAEDAVAVHHDGFGHDEACRLAADLLVESDGERPGRLVVDVTSARRHYGRLAAYSPAGGEFFAEELRLLRSYATYAAAALDAATALEEARVQGTTATMLLELARQLASVTSVQDAGSRLCAAIPGVAGADRAHVLLWDPLASSATVVATHGWEDPATSELRAMVLRPSESPTVAAMMADPQPRCFDQNSEDASLTTWLQRTGRAGIAVVPMEARGQLLGAIVADWMAGSPAPVMDEHLQERLVGVADQGASALTGARLLEQVTHQARHDALTGLANRVLFADRVEQALALARRHGRRVAVLFIDLDGFKPVNDTLGHEVGDGLLRQVAERLLGLVRDADTVARMGGDEFTVLLPEVESGEDVTAVAVKVLRALGAPFTVSEHEVRVAASVGGVVSSGSDSYDQLLRDADGAMYAVKQAGGNSFQLHAPLRQDRAPARSQLEVDLRAAIAGPELEVFYQPQVHLASGLVVTVEALARWRHPERGLLLPDAFIPFAEESGLIISLDLEVARRACRDAVRWEAEGVSDLRLAVNVSALHFEGLTLAEELADLLADTGLSPSRLELEMTETVALRPGATPRLLHERLRALGVGLAIDDFGTGFSVLDRLKHFPVDKLKIDRSFVEGIENGRGSLVIAILAMADTLDLEVVAEGVETEAQLDFLRAQGCEMAQGFLLGRPVPALEVPTALSGRVGMPLLTTPVG